MLKRGKKVKALKIYCNLSFKADFLGDFTEKSVKTLKGDPMHIANSYGKQIRRAGEVVLCLSKLRLIGSRAAAASAVGCPKKRKRGI